MSYLSDSCDKRSVPAEACERKQELTVLGAIGMTKKQIAAILSYEGIFRVLLVFALVELGYQSCWYEGHITDDDRICDKLAAILVCREKTVNNIEVFGDIKI